MVFQENKLKAVTLSYDDGVEQDRRLVELFNKYRLKCTFNLNSGIQTGANQWNNNGRIIKRMNIFGLKALYAGHEIALHTLTHPHLEDQDEETIRNEVAQDRRNLSALFGCDIHGMAYPFGTYNDRVLGVLREEGVRYARTVIETENFDVQTNLLEFKATCHHSNKNLMRLAEEFVALKPSEPKIFYVWGHSYEFDVDGTWDMMERFCAFISGRDDIYYGTNFDVLCRE